MSKNIDNMNTLFHITAIDNIDSIIKTGLKAGGDGYVYLFDGVSVRTPSTFGEFVPIEQIIASTQLALKDFGVFMINTKGLDIEDDNVAEYTSEFQYRCKGNISKKKIKFLGFGSSEEYVSMYKENMRKLINKID